MGKSQRDYFLEALKSYFGSDIEFNLNLNNLSPAIQSFEPYEKAIRALGQDLEEEDLNEIFNSAVVDGKSGDMLFFYDEEESFSQDRKLVLENYPELVLGYPIPYWIGCCVRKKANSQDSVRLALEEMIQDLEGVAAGYTIIRIEDGEFDWRGDKTGLIKMLVQNAESSDFKIK